MAMPEKNGSHGTQHNDKHDVQHLYKEIYEKRWLNKYLWMHSQNTIIVPYPYMWIRAAVAKRIKRLAARLKIASLWLTPNQGVKLEPVLPLGLKAAGGKEFPPPRSPLVP